MKTFTVKCQPDLWKIDPKIANISSGQLQPDQSKFHLGLNDFHKKGCHKYEDFTMGIQSTNFLLNARSGKQQNESFFMQQNSKIAAIMRMETPSHYAFEENNTKLLQLVDRPYQIASNSPWSMPVKSRFGIQLSFEPKTISSSSSSDLNTLLISSDGELEERGQRVQ